MKQFIAIALLFLSLAINGQEFVSKPAKAQTIESLTAHAVKTKAMYQGKPVWQSHNGKYFVIVTSKKTGRPYKKEVVVKT